MNTKTAPRNISLSAGACLLALAGAALAASGCSKSEAAPSREALPAPVAVAASPRVETDAFGVEIKATGPYKAGVEGAIELTLRSHGGYHMNDQYPFRFKVAELPAEGVSYPKATVQRADFSFAEENKNNPQNPDHKFDTAKAQIPFLAGKPGRATVAGTLLMSVCSDASCIMDKVPLELAVDVN
jgi:hypothetical protein